jgi:large subunit ribosomal protein L3
MMIGLLGRKVGMTRIFTDEGKSIPVTVVSVLPNRVSQIKTVDNDGYSALQLTAGTKKSNRVTKQLAGHFAKASIEAGDMMTEFRVEADALSAYTLGQELKIEDVFGETKVVDVSSVSKGKGFAGTVKRHNFRTQDATHGNSRSHRVPGSIGQNQSPGKVFKGKKMCGQMGNKACTVMALELVKIDSARNLMLIKGGIPGAPGTRVKLRPSFKQKAGGK